MELRNLISFIRAAELQSFSKTAEQLGYSQSAVTMQLKQLEEELGIPLFERIGKRVKLTQAGERFLPRALEVLEAVGRAQQVARSPRGDGLLALAAQERLEGNPEWQVVSPAHFGIVNFRFAPSKEAPDATWDQVNQEMAREVTATGFAQVYTTQLRGRTVLRLCAINPRTTPEDVLQTIQRLESTQAAERGRRLTEEKGLQVG